MGVVDSLACHFQYTETYDACKARRAEESAKRDELAAKDAGAKELSVGAKVAVDAKTNIEAANTSREQSLHIY